MVKITPSVQADLELEMYRIDNEMAGPSPSRLTEYRRAVIDAATSLLIANAHAKRNGEREEWVSMSEEDMDEYDRNLDEGWPYD